jgi:hypothetical protein
MPFCWESPKRTVWRNEKIGFRLHRLNMAGVACKRCVSLFESQGSSSSRVAAIADDSIATTSWSDIQLIILFPIQSFLCLIAFIL